MKLDYMQDLIKAYPKPDLWMPEKAGEIFNN